MGKSFSGVSIWIPDVPGLIDDFKLQKKEKAFSEVSIWIPDVSVPIDDPGLTKESVQMGKSLSEVSIWIPDVSISIDDFKQRNESSQRGTPFNEVSIWIPHISVPIEDFGPVDSFREDGVIPIDDGVWSERRLNRGCVADAFVCCKGNKTQRCVFNSWDVKIPIEDESDLAGCFQPTKVTLLFHYEVIQQLSMSQVHATIRNKRKRYRYDSRGLPGATFAKMNDFLPPTRVLSVELESVVWQ
nr:uncharacterized protein LOC113816610 [Penaeus vannamei]